MMEKNNYNTTERPILIISTSHASFDTNSVLFFNHPFDNYICYRLYCFYCQVYINILANKHNIVKLSYRYLFNNLRFESPRNLIKKFNAKIMDMLNKRVMSEALVKDDSRTL